MRGPSHPNLDAAATNRDGDRFGPLAYALLTAAPLVVVALALRLHKIALIQTAAANAGLFGDLPAAWQALLPELPPLAGWVAVVVLLLTLTRGRARRAAIVGLYVATVGQLGLLLAEHSFFLSSGALLDFQILKFAWTERATMWGAYAAELRPWHSVFALLALGLPAAPWLLARRWLPADDDSAASATGPGFWAVLLVCGLVGGGASLACSPVEGQPPQALRGRLALLQHSTWRALMPSYVAREALPPGTIRSLAPALLSRTVRTQRRNVVIIALESTRASATTPYNPKLDTTPFLSALAKKGVTAEHAYSVVPRTTQSMIALHCGFPSNIHHTFNEATEGALPAQCLPRMLRQMGYTTAHFQPTNLLFEDTRGLFEAFGYQHIEGREERKGDGFEEINYFGFPEHVLIEPAGRWAEAQQKQGKPFLLSMITNAPHHNYTSPKGWKHKRRSPKRLLDRYLNAVEYSDTFLRDLWADFARRGLLKDTLFVLIADHGEGFGEHGLFQHGVLLYEEGSHIPFILSGPWPHRGGARVTKAGGAKAGADALNAQESGPEGTIVPAADAGARVDGLWQTLDVVPTILDGLGLKVTGGWRPGRSLLRGAGHKRLYLGCWKKERCAGVVDDDGQRLVKTIYNYDRRDPEVFDIRRDPEEKNDLVAAGTVAKASLKPKIDAMAAWKADVNRRYAEAAARRRQGHVFTQNPNLKTPVHIDFGESLRLVGVDIGPKRLYAGEAVRVRLAFEVRKAVPADWRLFMHMEGPNKWFARLGHVPVNGSLPLKDWKVGTFVVDETWIPIDHHGPDGDYLLNFGFWRPKARGIKRVKPVGTGLPIAMNYRVKLADLHVVNPDFTGPPIPGRGRRFLKGEAKLAVSLPAPSTATLSPAKAVFGGDVAWLGSVIGKHRMRIGDKVQLTHRFRVLRDPPVATAFFVHLKGPDGSIINASHNPVGGAYPVERWQAGEEILDTHTVHVGKKRKPGRWQVVIGVYNPYSERPFHRWPVERLAAGVEVDDKRRLVVGEIEVVAELPHGATAIQLF